MKFLAAKPEFACCWLKQMLCTKSDVANKISCKCVYTSKKTEKKKNYIEKLKTCPKTNVGYVNNFNLRRT